MRDESLGHASLLGDHSKCDPPDPISNSEVKPLSADGSVGSPHVRVGHRQASNLKPHTLMSMGFFCVCDLILNDLIGVLSNLVFKRVLIQYVFSTDNFLLYADTLF